MDKLIEDGSGDPGPLFESIRLRTKTVLSQNPSIKPTILTKVSEDNKKKSRLKTWTLRIIFTIILIGYFSYTIYSGPILIILSTITIQVICFKELINVAFKLYPMERIPHFKFISCYFLLSFNYFFCGETMVKYFNVYIDSFGGFRILVTCHRFISFCIYFLGVIWFVLHVLHNNKYDKEQFSLLAFTHVALIILAAQSYMIVKNIFQGHIWLILSVTSVACNDIMAYVCGSFLGKTPLIKVSPKKTWEGFIGGAVFTSIHGYLLSLMLCRYQYLVCPIEYKTVNGSIQMVTDCEPSPLFQWTVFNFNINIFDLLKISGECRYYPFMIHAFAITSFISLIAPFGGFFASGFKRAFKVKDFGYLIPGHGGIMDRFDCHYMVATFVNVYISSFIKHHTVDIILEKIFYMKDEQQLQLFYMLEDVLKKNNVSLSG